MNKNLTTLRRVKYEKWELDVSGYRESNLKPVRIHRKNRKLIALPNDLML